MVFIIPSVYSSPPSSRSLNTDVILCSYPTKPLALQEICPRTTKRDSWRAWLSHQTYWPYHIKNLPKPFGWGIKKNRTNLIKTILYEDRKKNPLRFPKSFSLFSEGSVCGYSLVVARAIPRIMDTLERFPHQADMDASPAPNPGYTQFLHSLPLNPKASKVKLYTGGNAHFQTMN